MKNDISQKHHSMRISPKPNHNFHPLERSRNARTLAPPVVQRVCRDGPAQRAGLVVGDEWISLDGLRLRSIDDLVVHLQPEAPLIPHQLLFCRDGLVRSTVLLPTAPAVESWQLQLDPATTHPGCAERRRRWLGLEAA